MATNEKVYHACCRFCGRLVAKQDAAKHPYFMTIHVGSNNTPKALIVADAIWCGECRPQPEPIDMPDLY